MSGLLAWGIIALAALAVVVMLLDPEHDYVNARIAAAILAIAGAFYALAWAVSKVNP